MTENSIEGWLIAGFALFVLPPPCRAEAPTTEPPKISKHALEAAADHSASKGGVAFLVMQNGQVVFERYEKGFDHNSAFHLHSGTKGFWGPVIAAMIEDQLIRSFDELASDTLTEWRNTPIKSKITLRHLLQLNAGLAQDIPSLQGHDRKTLAPDLYAHAVQLPIVSAPGRRFAYGPSCYYALGEIMKRKLAQRQQTPLDYLRQRILTPIGVETGEWVHDRAGNPHIPNGAWMTARNWAKFGQWMLQEGAWEGKQIVRAELMKELREPSGPNPGHGLAIWLNRPKGFDPQSQRTGRPPKSDKAGFIYPDGHPDLFAALGAGANRMYIIPELSLVVVRQTDRVYARFDDAELLRHILGDQ